MTQVGSGHTPWRVPLPQALRHVPALTLSLQRGAQEVAACSMQAVCVVPPLILRAAAPTVPCCNRLLVALAVCLLPWS